MQKTHGYALCMLLLLGVTWGSGYSLARYALTHGVQPLGYAFWQSLGPGVLLTLWVAIKEKKLLPMDKQSLKFYAICGLVGIAVPNANMFFCAQRLPAGILAVTINTAPIFILLISKYILKKPIPKHQQWGVLCALIAILSLNGAHIHAFKFSPWLITSLISPVCFACAALFIQQKQPSHSTSRSSAAGMMWLSTVMLLPLVLHSHQFYPLWRGSFDTTHQVIFAEMCLSSLGYVLFFRLILVAGAIYYSLVSAVVALTGTLLGALFLGEHFSWPILLCMFGIISGVVIASLPGKSRKNEHSC